MLSQRVGRWAIIAAACALLPFLFAAPSILAARSTPAQSVISADEVRKILIDRIDVERQNLGMVVGILGPRGRRIIAYGHPDMGDTRQLDGDSIFEIGSNTKIFTALLAADMVQRGEIRLEDPIAKYLPVDVKVPARAGRQITIVDLLTHTSGLPRDPTNMPTDPSNTESEYTNQQLYSFLSSYTLDRDIGSQYLYSNLGFGLLGHVLELRAGTDYASLLAMRITGPLNLQSTVVLLPKRLEARLIPGHNGDFARVRNFGPTGLQGAGAIRSSANDLLTFLAGLLHYKATPLAPAMDSLVSVARPMGIADVDAGLGWVMTRRGGSLLIWHNGGTPGYRSFMGYNPGTRVGVVVLSNVITPEGIDDIGFHILNPKRPVFAPTLFPKEASLNPELMNNYVGTYQVSPSSRFIVTREADHLVLEETPDFPRSVLRPQSVVLFYSRVIGLAGSHIAFELDAQHRASALTISAPGLAVMRGQRVADGQATTP